MHSAMINYRPWPQYQQMLIEQHPYYQFVGHDMHLQYAINNHQEEEYKNSRDEMPSEVSDDQNHNTDMFRLAFAASQWSKLVLNAEGLFNKLMSTNALPANEQNLLKNQIEQWLCMKQEYEECIAGDESASLHGYTENTRRSLERIEEVTETTETDEKTDESNNWECKQLQVRDKSCSTSSLNTSSKSETYESSSDVTDDSDESDVDSENSDFIDKLEESLKQFEADTEEVVNSIKNDTITSNSTLAANNSLKSRNSTPENDFNSQNNSPEPNSDCANNVTSAKSDSMRKQSVRRISILPHSEMSNELAEFQKQNCNSNNFNLQQNNNYDLIPLDTFNCNEKTETQSENQDDIDISIDAKSESMKVNGSLAIDSEHLSTLKMLRTELIEKQLKVGKIHANLKSLENQILDLEKAIQQRELFIEEIQLNVTARSTAKQKYNEWQRKYEERYRKYDKLLLSLEKSHRNAEENRSHLKQMENCKQVMKRCEKKIKDIRNLKQIVDTSEKTLASSQAAVLRYKKEMELLEVQFKNEEKYKKELNSDIDECQKRIKQLEDVYNLTPANFKKILSASDDGKKHRMKVKGDENECSVETNLKSLSLNSSIKDRSNCTNADDIDEKESIRKEIRDLRHIKDLLIKIQCNGFTAKMTPTTKVNRNALKLREFIECIDAMIEEKNIMICSKANLNQTGSNKLDEQMPVFARLEKLSHKELVTLFYTYFNKVVDLKDSTQELEEKNTNLEREILHLKMEHERKLIDFHMTYEKHIAMLLRSYPDESSSSVCDSRVDRSRDIAQICKENYGLKQRLHYFESLFKYDKPALSQAIQPHAVGNTKPVYKPQLEHAAPLRKTIVTRQRNKIIFQNPTR